MLRGDVLFFQLFYVYGQLFALLREMGAMQRPAECRSCGQLLLELLQVDSFDLTQTANLCM